MPSLYRQILCRHTTTHSMLAALCLCAVLLLSGCHSSYSVDSDGNPEIPKGGIVPPPVSAEQKAVNDRVVAALTGKSFNEQQQYIRANRAAYLSALRNSNGAVIQVLAKPGAGPSAAP